MIKNSKRILLALLACFMVQKVECSSYPKPYKPSLSDKMFSNPKGNLTIFLLAHTMVEALCEGIYRLRKLEGSKPGKEGFAKDLLERVAFCGKDGLVSWWSIIKAPVKFILAGWILNAITVVGIEPEPFSFFPKLLLAHIFFEFVAELKDRGIGSKENNPGSVGFTKDFFKRALDGKKDKEFSWVTVSKFPAKCLLAYCFFLQSK